MDINCLTAHSDVFFVSVDEHFSLSLVGTTCSEKNETKLNR